MKNKRLRYQSILIEGKFGIILNCKDKEVLSFLSQSHLSISIFLQFLYHHFYAVYSWLG